MSDPSKAYTDEEPIHISWSSLQVASLCHQKSYLYRQGLRSPISNIRNFFPGRCVDLAMRNWLRSEEKIPGAMVTMIEEIINKEEKETIERGNGVVKWRDAEDKQKVIDWCKEAVTRLEPCLDSLVLPYRFEVAKRFKVPVELPYGEDEYRLALLTGEMDLLVQDNEDMYIVSDLKATSDKYYWKKSVGQLIFYDIVCQLLYDIERCKETGFIFPMLDNPIMMFDFTQDDYRMMWARIQRYAIDAWHGNIRPKESDTGCNWCDVRISCDKYKIVPGKSLFGGNAIEGIFS